MNLIHRQPPREMPIAQPAQPLTFQIYDALTPESLRIFRAAMERNRDGIVRVEDLIAALATHGPSVTVDVLEEVWRPARCRHGERLVPMSNEPALREVLATAYQIAGEQSSAAVVEITPAVMVAAIFTSRHLPVPTSLPLIFERLSLHRPEQIGTRDAGRRTGSCPPPSDRSHFARRSAEELMDEILDEWLQMQTSSDRDERNHQRAALAERVREFEALAAAIHDSRRIHWRCGNSNNETVW